jgi:ribonuclease D
VIGNEQLRDIARLQPRGKDDLLAIKGVPRGLVENRAREILDAVQRGLAVPEDALPKFPKGPRWDRDPQFDTRVGALKTIRDEAAQRLDMDPGVLASRERLEAVARAKPKSVDDLAAIPGLRRWQIDVMGADFVKSQEKI